MNNYNYLFKFIIVGDTSVGKSCLLLQYIDQRFRDEHDATIGIEFGAKNLTLKDQSIKIQIWDTAGQESFRSITRSYYRGSIGALLCFDITSRSSFDSIARWQQDIMGFACEKIVLFLVGNKSDLEDDRQVTTEEAQRFAQKYGMQYLETSAKSGENVDAVFEKLGLRVLEGIQDGSIDPTQEINGIKIGALTVVKQGISTGNNNSELSQNKTKSGGCC